MSDCVHEWREQDHLPARLCGKCGEWDRPLVAPVTRERLRDIRSELSAAPDLEALAYELLMEVERLRKELQEIADSGDFGCSSCDRMAEMARKAVG